MNYSDVADALAGRLQLVPGLNVSVAPVQVIVGPAAVVGVFDQMDFDLTYGRGMDQMTIPVLLLLPESPDPRTVRQQLSRYTAGAGTWSVKAALESGGAVSGVLSSVQVQRVQVEPVTVAGSDYLGASFTVNISGSGRS